VTRQRLHTDARRNASGKPNQKPPHEEGRNVSGGGLHGGAGEGGGVEEEEGLAAAEAVCEGSGGGVKRGEGWMIWGGEAEQLGIPSSGAAEEAADDKHGDDGRPHGVVVDACAVRGGGGG
jgi:hypothetical protein